MARTGRPPIAPPLFLTPTQRKFYAWVVKEVLGGHVDLIPDDPQEAFRAGIAVGRQYPKWAEMRRKDAS